MPECDYEGCDEPALEDSDKCIYHKPNKNEEEAREFYKLIRQEAREPLGEKIEDKEGEEHRRWVFEDEVEWKGYQFPTIPSESSEDQILFSFRNNKFVDRAVFMHATFEEDADFMHATFEGNASFGSATFEEDADFMHATFEGNASFGSATFEGFADFRSATFEGLADFMPATFEEDAVFGSATFEGLASFGSATFEGLADFMHATFEGLADFMHATFEEDAVFRSATFEGFADFRSATFEGFADFRSATFEEDADFLAVKFFGDCFFIATAFYGDLVLKNNHFEYRPQFISDLDELDSGVERKEDNISDSIDLLRSTSSPIVQIVITPEENSEVVFRERGDAIERLEELPEIEGMILYIEKFAQPQAKAEGCREQRLTFESKGKKEEADQVFVHEMRARRRTKDGRIMRFLDWLVADLTCVYGTRWQRVIFNSVGIMFFAGLLFWACSILTVKFDSLWPWVGVFKSPEVPINEAISLHPWGYLKGLGDSLYYSVITFTTLGFGDLHPAGLTVKLLSGLESALGALFVALIIVVFARKWMRN